MPFPDPNLFNKSTFQSRPTIPTNKKLTASSWNSFVQVVSDNYQEFLDYISNGRVTIDNDVAGRLVTAKGDGNLNAEENITYDGTTVNLNSRLQAGSIQVIGSTITGRTQEGATTGIGIGQYLNGESTNIVGGGVNIFTGSGALNLRGENGDSTECVDIEAKASGVTGDTGTDPVMRIITRGNNAGNIPITVRPQLSHFNHTTKIWEVLANNNWDYQGNDLGNINEVSSDYLDVETSAQIGDIEISGNTIIGKDRDTGDPMNMIVGNYDANSNLVGAKSQMWGNECRVTGQSLVSTDELVRIEAAADAPAADLGTTPAITIITRVANSFTPKLVTRPAIIHHNGDPDHVDSEELWELSADGEWDYKGNANTNLGSIGLLEQSTDPADPAEGESRIWQSNGVGSGDDGDIMIKITAGGVTKTATMIDFSAI